MVTYPIFGLKKHRQVQAGITTDAANYISMNRYPVENITAPTMAISTRDDLFKTFAGAKYTADNIPGAKFIGFESGGSPADWTRGESAVRDSTVTKAAYHRWVAKKKIMVLIMSNRQYLNLIFLIFH